MNKLREKRPAVFLDRDGVIIKEKNFLIDPEEIDFYPGSIEALKKIDNIFAKVIVSNQSGIARGYFTEKDLKIFNLNLEKMMAEFFIRIDGWYYCPHGPDDDCDCRKPKTGMITKAVAELNLDLKQSWIIGDKSSDIKTGEIAGMKTILVKTGYGGNEPNAYNIKPDYYADDLLASINYINGSIN